MSRVIVCQKLIRKQKEISCIVHTFIIVNVFFCQAFNIENGEVDISEVIHVQLGTSRRVIDYYAHD